MNKTEKTTKTFVCKKSGQWYPFILLAPAPLIFFTIITSQISKLPFWDDYDSVLGFLLQLRGFPDAVGKIAFILTAQHNEYRLIFENCIFALDDSLLGHPHFALLAFIGNLSVLPICYFLWKALQRHPAEVRIAWFLPVSLILFQLNYAETLDWAMGGLQNLAVLAFALGSLYTLSLNTRRSFAAAALFLLLAISASGNGLILWPVCLLMLVEMKRWRQALAWFLLGLASIALYFLHYHRNLSQTGAHPSILHGLAHLNPAYFFSFLGSAVGENHDYIRYLSPLWGLVLFALFLWMFHKRAWRNNRFAFYLALFVLITALGVTCLRSDLGFGQSMSSRYKIYSDLFMIAVCIFLANLSVSKRTYRFLLTCTVLFALVNDVHGFIMLHQRGLLLQRGVEVYRHSGGTSGPVLPYSNRENLSEIEEHNQTFRVILHQSEIRGLYRLP
jgi:hypothetical protein